MVASHNGSAVFFVAFGRNGGNEENTSMVTAIYPACLWQIRLVGKPYVALFVAPKSGYAEIAKPLRRPPTALAHVMSLGCASKHLTDRYICRKQAVWPAHCRALARLLLPRPALFPFRSLICRRLASQICISAPVMGAAGQSDGGMYNGQSG